MTDRKTHFFAMAAAVLLTVVSMQAIVTVPPAHAASIVELA